MRRLPSHKFFHSAAPFYLALLLLVISLLISLSSGYVLYASFRDASDEKVRQICRLVEVRHEISEPQVASSAEFVMLSLLDDRLVGKSMEDDAKWFSVFREIREVSSDILKIISGRLHFLMEKSNSHRVLLVSPQGRIIADASEKLQPGERFEIDDGDRSAWESALEGVAMSVPHEGDGILTVRNYGPVRLLAPEEYKGRVGAVLVFESVEPFKSVKDLQHKAIVFAVIVIGLTTIVALLFNRLMRLLVRINETAAHSDRLQAMGTLAAGIAHEIRNPLGIIRAMAEGVRSDMDDEDPAREMLDDITDEVERLNGLVTQYLQFARPDAHQPGEKARPDAIIETIVPLLQKGDRQAAPIRVETNGPVPPVSMNEAALRQVLLNLLMNAREASKPDQPVVVRCSAQRASAQVRIEVIDKGSGISARDMRHIFDPFFTTRPKGSGLGLSICRQLVTEVRGTIDIQSTPGAGTTVRLVLPTGKSGETRTSAK